MDDSEQGSAKYLKNQAQSTRFLKAFLTDRRHLLNLKIEYYQIVD